MPSIALAQSQVIKKVVIDPGHGGKDPGACNKKVYEKDIVLSVALKLGAFIKENFKDIEVIYTRSTDEFIELHRRASIANQSKADLFISLHCNSNTSPDPYGFETFVMGANKSKANLDIAKKENATILFEDNYSNQYDGFDPNSAEADVIFTLYQNAFLKQSLSLAYSIQKQFKDKLKRFDRGVGQAGFLVLYRTTMPSILIESGFLSNPDEERFIGSENGQVYIASAIYRAFKEYKASVEGTTVKLDETDKIDFKEVVHSAVDTTEKQSVIDNISKEQTNKPIDNVTKSSDKPKENVAKKDSVVKVSQKEIDNQKIKPVFKVQILSSNKKIALNAADFKGIAGVEEYQDGSMYKYTVGGFATIEEASALSKKMREKGFTGAFLTAFCNGKKISLDEARNLMK